MAPCVASEYSCRSIAKALTARIAGLLSKTCLNLANLTDEQPIEAEDNYRICVRRGRDEETKPKKRQLEMEPDAEHEEGS